MLEENPLGGQLELPLGGGRVRTAPKQLELPFEQPVARSAARGTLIEETPTIANSRQRTFDFEPEQLELPLGSEGISNRARFSADEVRFSQNSVSYNKIDRLTGKRYTYDDLVESMKTKGWKGDPVDVVEMPDNRITSIDNTRIRAARETGTEVEATVRSFDKLLTLREIRRFTEDKFPDPKTWGDAIMIRIKKQTGGFPKKYPFGSDELPKIRGKGE